MEDDIRLINLISEPVPLVDIIDQYFNRRNSYTMKKLQLKQILKLFIILTVDWTRII